MSTTPGSLPGGVDDDRSVGALLKELGREVPSLLNSQVALLKAEAHEAMRSTRAGVAAVSTGGAVMMAGLVVVLMAIAYALANVIELWMATGIVGIGAMLVGWLMVQSGKKKFDSDELRPGRSIDAIRKDKDAISGRTP